MTKDSRARHHSNNRLRKVCGCIKKKWPTCRLIVDGSECTASASVPARRGPSFTRWTSR